MDSHSSELLAEMFRSCPDALIVAGDDGIVRVASSALESLFGYQVDDIVGRPLEMLLPESARGRHEGHMRRYMQAPTSRPMGADLDLQGRRADGSLFPVDVSLVPVHVDGHQLVGAFVRDVTAQRRSLTVQRFINEITTKATAGEPTQVLLELAADRARQIVDADAGWILLSVGFSGSATGLARGPTTAPSEAADVAGAPALVVVAASGVGVDAPVGSGVPPHASLVAKVMSQEQAVIVEDMSSDAGVHSAVRAVGFGCGAYLPMQVRGSVVGCLVLARSGGRPCFEPAEIAPAETFASALAVVLDLAGTRVSLQEVKLAAEHERIARDLHDTVIQRLFAIGMGLQSTEREAGPALGGRIRSTVDAIDEVIREIRETIFDLSHPSDDSNGESLRSRVRKVLADATDQLGFAPRLEFRGPVESSVPDELHSDVAAVVREALSNVARHAKASAADVIVAADDATLTVFVSDDGLGMSDSPSAGHGLANLLSRASDLGGDLRISGRKPSGTVVVWRVPLK